MNTRTESRHVLTPLEEEESLPLVCYERSLYHFLRRNEAFAGFYWLYADRHYHMHYMAGENEALQFDGDGLTRLLPQLETVEQIPAQDLFPRLRDRLESGWQARSMLLTKRPDGSQYTTSSLIEAVADDGFIVTKTNEHIHETMTYVSVDDLFARFKFMADGSAVVGFLKINPGLRAELTSRTGAALFMYIMKDLYGYELRDRVLYMSGRPVGLEESACRQLYDSVRDDPGALFGIQSDKGLQLRLNKHIGNKLQPLWRTWEACLLPDPEIASCIPEEVSSALRNAGSDCHAAHSELQKRFILLARRQTRRTVDGYLAALDALATSHDRWTDAADRCFTNILHECTGA